MGAGKLTPEQIRKHVLETCWRCNQWGIVENEELGLCQRCIEKLKDPDFVCEFKVVQVADGPTRSENREGERG